jgi:CDGSH-type Zn-finger protein
MRRDEVLIVPYQNGPLLVRGPVVVRDQEGRGIHVNRSPVALCRCGKSRMRPFCDGTHRLIRFVAPSSAETHSFDAAQATGESTDARSRARPRPLRRRADDPGAQNGGSTAKSSNVAVDPPILTKLDAAHHELRRLKERLEDGPCTARQHVALRAAERLIEAASLLLGELLEPDSSES